MQRVVLWIVAAVATSPALSAVALDLATVSFPDVNCVFDTDCTITVQDTSDRFALPATSGDAFLQSRTWPIGEPGTAGGGLTAYLYRLDLRQLAGLTALPCVTRLALEFGPVSPLDYDGDAATEHVFVGTSGGLGSVGPSSAEKNGSQITFHFQPPVCAGSSPGAGQSSYFFGLASTRPPRDVTATIQSSLGDTLTLAARAPQALLILWPPPWWLWTVIVVVLATVWLLARRGDRLPEGA